jgi:hypothetical protein
VIVTHHVPTRSDHTTDHTLSWDCWCLPKVMQTGQGYTIKHKYNPSREPERSKPADYPPAWSTADTPSLPDPEINPTTLSPVTHATTCDDRGNDWNLPCEKPWRHTGRHQWEDREWSR